MKIENSQNGQMLMEVLFSLSVVVLVLVALIAGAIIATRNASQAKNMVLANQLAQEAMEIVKKEKDSLGWEEFKTEHPYGMQGLDIDENFNDDCPSAATPANYENFFIRCVTFEEIDELAVKVTATVFWTGSACSTGVYCHKAEIVSSVSKWSK